MPRRYKEINIQKLFDSYKSNPEFIKYFPNDKKPPGKYYFWCILNTVAPHAVKNILDQIDMGRKKETPNANKIK